MTDILVASSTELNAALRIAQSGDIIRLGSGTYDGISMFGTHFAGAGVRITSADPGNPAELLGVRLTQSSGLTIANVTLKDMDAATDYTFQVKDSSNIVFDGIKLVGPAGDIGYTANPFMIRASTNVTITNSEFTHMRYGVNLLDSNGVTVTNNYFHDIRTDGVRGGGTSNVVISNNRFTDFFPADGDHPDAIQFWTNGISTIASNITITDNEIVRGNGAPMQGIFMRDEATNLPYTNVVISGNLVLGGMYNGIYVNHANGLQITNNIVDGFADQKSWISVNQVTTLSGNAAQTYMFGGSERAPADNIILAAAVDGGAALASLWQSLDGAAVTSASLADASIATVAAKTTSVASSTTTTTTTPTTTTTSLSSTLTKITGTTGDDRLIAAKSGITELYGLAGNDIFTGGAGETRMYGGAGDDAFTVYSSRDTVIEEAAQGTDTVNAYVSYTLTANVEILRMKLEGLTGRGNALDNRMVGTDGSDTLYGAGGADSMQGQGGNDALFGEAGADRLAGEAGDDYLDGGADNDVVMGGEGNDTMFGGLGADTLDPGTGNNAMTGGGGKDRFLFKADTLGGSNRILDFSAADGDKIDLSGIDANTKISGDGAFRFIGTAQFSRRAGELRYVASGGNAIITGDVNGDGVADFNITLNGLSYVSSSYFTL